MSQYYRNNPDEKIRHCWIEGGTVSKMPEPKVWKVTTRHGGTVHIFRKFAPGLSVITKCGRELPQWRDADSKGKPCSFCHK